MEKVDASRLLKTFSKVSNLRINEFDRSIRGYSLLNAFSNSQKISANNGKIQNLILERNCVQGRLDSVKLEVLNMLMANPELCDGRELRKMGFETIFDFVEEEKERISLRGLYSDNPCSIKEILIQGATALEDKCDFFDEEPIIITNSDVVNAVDKKSVKVLFKK